jgi:O-antigen ligase/tetratricopeptide (TPR) repeat protein
VIEAGWLAALVTTPLFFHPYGRQVFEPSKAAVLRVVTLVMAAAFVVKLGGGGRAAAPGGAPVERALGAGAVARLVRVPLLLPTLLVLASTTVSTVASVDPRASVFGTYLRAQGLLATLGYAVFFALVVAHLRTPEQWRRVLYALTVTGFTVATYAVLQRLGFDPVAWTDPNVRVGSTLGNPIFLAAYLGFVLFVSAHAIGTLRPRLRRRSDGGSGAHGGALAAALLVSTVALAVAAIALSQSRGPLLGVLAGGFFAALALLLHAGRARRAAGGSTSAWRPPLVLIAAAVAVVAVLWIASRPGALPGWLRDHPQWGRLAAPFDVDSPTAQVRLLIWRSGLALLEEHPSLDRASTTGDAARLLLGYGPETFRLAFSRYHPPEFARFDDPRTAPDRAHNETLDRLVETGVLGLLCWVVWLGALFFHVAAGLFPGAVGRQRLFWGSFGAGAVLGAALPALLDATVLSFVGLPLGMLAGVAVFLAVAAAERANGSHVRAGWTARDTLLIAILAALTAHLVETSLGIAVIVTKVHVWFLAAVLVALLEGWLVLDDGEAVDAIAERDRGSRLATGLLGALVVATASFPFLGNAEEHRDAADVLASNLAAPAGRLPVAAPLALAILSGVAAVLAAGRARSSPAAGRGRVDVALGLALGGAYVVYQCHRLARTSDLRHQGRPLLEVLEHIAGHAGAYVGFVLLWLLVAGIAIAARGRGPRPSPAAPWRTWLAIAAVGAATAPLYGLAVRALSADALLNHGLALGAGGRPDLAMPVLRRSVELAPREPAIRLEVGGVAAAAARAAADDGNRRAFLAEAEASLDRARALAPLDPDHPANLARFHAIAAELAQDDAARRSSLERAAVEFENALRLRPGWPLVLAEYAAAEHRRGERAAAFALLERALALDPIDLAALRTQARLLEEEGRLAHADGDYESAAAHRARAASIHERILRTPEEHEKPVIRFDR